MKLPAIDLMPLLSKPAFSLAGWICALLATLTATYLYVANHGQADLSYYVKPIRTIVARAEHPSDFQIFSDGKEIKTAVTAAEVVIWNRGHQAIHTSQILAPLVLHTKDYTPILDVQIRSTRDITGISLKGESLATGRAILYWRILEPGDGGVIRIIYAGGPNIDIVADGIIEGQPQLSRLEPPEGTIYRREFNHSLQIGVKIFLMVFCTLVGLSILFLFWLSAMEIYPMRWFTLIGAVVLLVCLAVLVYGLMYDYVEPPVGFRPISSIILKDGLSSAEFYIVSNSKSTSAYVRLAS